MPRLAFLVVALVAASACTKPDPVFCTLAANANDPHCNLDAMGPACHVSGDCTGAIGRPVCDTGKSGGACVQCTAQDMTQCRGTTPVCTDDACRGCASHTDCPDSNVCLPDGSCALTGDVAYVNGATTMDGRACTKAEPCRRIEEAAMKKAIVKVTGTVTVHSSLNNGTVTILADPGAKLMPATSPPDDRSIALEIKGTSVAKVYDLEINHANGGQPGVQVSEAADVQMTRVRLIANTADGARVSSGKFTCTRCTIEQNVGRGIAVSGGTLIVSQSFIRYNAAGGINVNSASFQIVGNVIYGNGGDTKVTGGISVSADGATSNRIDFNSISSNTSTPTVAPGIQCASGMPLTANYNIVWTTGNVFPQVSSGCSYAFSDIGPAPSGINLALDPKFVNEAGGDLHLMPGSPARRAATGSVDVSGPAEHDIDGDLRTVPADLGADQTP